MRLDEASKKWKSGKVKGGATSFFDLGGLCGGYKKGVHLDRLI